jgi:hypothetical protein
VCEIRTELVDSSTTVSGGGSLSRFLGGTKKETSRSVWRHVVIAQTPVGEKRIDQSDTWAEVIEDSYKWIDGMWEGTANRFIDCAASALRPGPRKSGKGEFYLRSLITRLLADG